MTLNEFSIITTFTNEMLTRCLSAGHPLIGTMSLKFRYKYGTQSASRKFTNLLVSIQLFRFHFKHERPCDLFS